MRRYFSADFHLGMSALLPIENWPFKNIQKHDEALIRSCNERAKEDDIIYHLGDFAVYGLDNHTKTPSVGLNVKPMEYAKLIKAQFVNIRGNHDFNNKVKSICDSMHIFLSKKYPSVSLSHYPTYDKRIDASCLHSPIHFCGHVHGAWKHCLDLDHQILNINVGCMVWGFKVVSEEELINYLDFIFSKKSTEVFRCRNINGKLKFFQE